MQEVLEQNSIGRLPTNLSNVKQIDKSFQGIISECPKMHKIFSIIKKVAKTDTTALILGETGTGKELIAKALHVASGRKGRLIPVNCGAIPEDILESELFGHEKGSFTGAISSRIGRFQMADGGTIFLDEIGDMSPKLQVKILRVLQEKKVEPVGSVKSVSVDVRIVAATHKDLKEEVKAGRFREDLFYRLQVIPLNLPSLRSRTNDIVCLAKYFVNKFCKQFDFEKINLSDAFIKALENYNWPGNVRELENLMERLVVMAETNSLEINDLPDYILGKKTLASIAETEIIEIPAEGLDFNELVNSYENHLITLALQHTKGNKKAAAKVLNLNRTTLVEKIKKKGLSENIEVIVQPQIDNLFTP